VLTTALCRRLGIALPIVQAPIGSATTPELAAAVSRAGGLGTLALTWSPPSAAANRMRRTQQLTDAPFAVNLGLAFPIDDQLDAALDCGVPIISTFWGDPAPVHPRIAAAGAVHLHTVGSADEARAAVDAGVDVIVAQGWEAGGHVWGEVATLPLVPAVVDAVAPTPVIAAGGIADGRGIAAALVLGAQAAWLGTRFLACTEAATHPHYRERIVAGSASDARYTGCFDGGWPDAPHRVLRNGTLEAWERAGRPSAPHRPGEGEVVARDPRGAEFRRYDDMMPLPHLDGALDDMALYAGQSVGLVGEVTSAADLMARLADEAERALARA
jgi:NAD(P)H-dependent flavin oxidoreductase YrpB (nitropropane dioxygenase family)